MHLRVASVFLCAMLAIVVACERLPGAPKASIPVVVGSPSWTLATFNTNCRGCHSQGAEGAALPLVNPGYWKIANDDQITKVIALGQGVSMPGYLDENGGPFSADEIDALVKGMRSMWGGEPHDGNPVLPGTISPTLVVGDAVAGALVFESACANCHGANGPAGSVTDPMYLRLISDQGLWSAVVYGRSELGSPPWNSPMPNHPNGLTPTEVADVVSWLATKRTQ